MKLLGPLEGLVCKKKQKNLSSAELQALQELKADDSIMILLVDKGSAMVVMNTRDYQRKVEELLDLQTYRKLRKDPTAVVLRRTDFPVFTGASSEIVWLS